MDSVSLSSLIRVFDATIQNASIISDTMNSRDLVRAFHITSRLQDHIMELMDSLNNDLASRLPSTPTISTVHCLNEIFDEQAHQRSSVLISPVSRPPPPSNDLRPPPTQLSAPALLTRQNNSATSSSDAETVWSNPCSVQSKTNMRKTGRIRKARMVHSTAKISARTSLPPPPCIESEPKSQRRCQDNIKTCTSCAINFPNVVAFVKHIQQVHVIERGEDPEADTVGRAPRRSVVRSVIQRYRKWNNFSPANASKSEDSSFMQPTSSQQD